MDTFFAREKREAALKVVIDEMGEVREQLRALRLREAALRQEIESYRPAGYVMADRYELTRSTMKKRKFNLKALPAEIKDDPSYWYIDKVATLNFAPLDPAIRAPKPNAVSDAYADKPIELRAEKANYGRPILPDPGPTTGPERRFGSATINDDALDDDALADILADLNEAAEPAAKFDWKGAPKRQLK